MDEIFDSTRSGEASEPCETRLVARLEERGESVATAESCSGGLIAHRLTNVPGASAVFLGGVVAYSNAAKSNLLAVSGRDIAEHGAVSEPVARQLAAGARLRFGAHYGIGVTGIAGPGGGTEEKPVGLVFIAVSRAGECRIDRNLFEGGREAVKTQTAERALALLWEWVT